MQNVAIIGAGPGGLVAARWCKAAGLDPIIFEASDRLGGQWGGDPAVSGIWDGMRTNTSRILTAFSDLDFPVGTAVYPTNLEVCHYLHRFAEHFGLEPRFRTRVLQIHREQEAEPAEWIVEFTGPDGIPQQERFEKIIIASGRCNHPLTPRVAGIESFAGTVSHSFDYREPHRYRGQRVIVAGGAVSGLEIASDLAMLGAEVTLSQRRQRYVLPKLIAGQPSDHVLYNRFAALTQVVVPQDVVMQGLKDFVLRAAGNPAQYGAPRPADLLEDAGVSLSQHYLPLVAEGKIRVKPWLSDVAGNQVRFTDGSEQAADHILFATGFGLHLPFLTDRARQTLDLDATHLDLYKYTFHHDLPGMAFIGLYELLGPYFPVLELQARWIAYTYSGARPMPSREEMAAGVAFYRAHRHESQRVPVHIFARILAREAGVEANWERHPELARALLFGPLSTVSYRLDGPDALADAGARISAQAAEFGVVPGPEFSPQQKAMLGALAQATGDSQMALVAGA